MKTLHAYYSAEADELFGHSVYLNSEGEEIKCTCVGENKDETEKFYKWEDKIYLGEVVKWIKSVNYHHIYFPYSQI